MYKQRWRGLVVAGTAVVVAVGALGAGASAHPQASAAKTVALREVAQMHLTRNTESLHEAKGTAVGTLGGTIFLRIKVDNASKMSAYYIGTSGSSTLTGKGSVSYIVSGSKLHFKGSSVIVQGTGKYKNAHGTGIQLEGTMNRLTERITMNVNGSITTK